MKPLPFAPVVNIPSALEVFCSKLTGLLKNRLCFIPIFVHIFTCMISLNYYNNLVK